jgi:hypothetical protein
MTAKANFLITIPDQKTQLRIPKWGSLAFGDVLALTTTGTLRSLSSAAAERPTDQAGEGGACSKIVALRNGDATQHGFHPLAATNSPATLASAAVGVPDA